MQVLTIAIYAGSLLLFIRLRPLWRMIGPSLLDSYVIGVALFAVGSVFVWLFLPLSHAAQIMQIGLAAGISSALGASLWSVLLARRIHYLRFVGANLYKKTNSHNHFLISAGLIFCSAVCIWFLIQVSLHAHLRELLLATALGDKGAFNQARLIVSSGVEGYFAPGYVKQFRDIGIPVLCTAALLCHGTYRARIIFYSAIAIALIAMFVSGQRLVILVFMLCLGCGFIVDLLGPAPGRLMPLRFAIPIFLAMGLSLILLTQLLGRAGIPLTPEPDKSVQFAFGVRWQEITGTTAVKRDGSLLLTSVTKPGEENKYRLQSEVVTVKAGYEYQLRYSIEAEGPSLIGIVDRESGRWVAQESLSGQHSLIFIAPSSSVWIVVASADSPVGNSTILINDLSLIPLGAPSLEVKRRFEAFGLTWSAARAQTEIDTGRSWLSFRDRITRLTRQSLVLTSNPISVVPEKFYSVAYEMTVREGSLRVGVLNQKSNEWIIGEPAGSSDRLYFRAPAASVRFFIANDMQTNGITSAVLQKFEVREETEDAFKRHETYAKPSRDFLPSVQDIKAVQDIKGEDVLRHEEEVKKISLTGWRAADAVVQLAHRAVMAVPQENTISYDAWADAAPTYGRGWIAELGGLRFGTQQQMSNKLSAAIRYGEQGNSPLALPTDLYYNWGLSGVVVFSAIYALLFFGLDLYLSSSGSPLLWAGKLFLFVSIPFMYSPFLFLLYGGAVVLALAAYVLFGGAIRSTIHGSP